MNSEIPNLKTPGLRTLSHIQPLEFHDVVTNIRNCMALTSLQHGKGAMKPRLVSSCFCSSSFFSSTLLGIRDGHDKSPPFCSMMFPLKLTSHLYVLPIYICNYIYTAFPVCHVCACPLRLEPMSPESQSSACGSTFSGLEMERWCWDQPI